MGLLNWLKSDLDQPWIMFGHEEIRHDDGTKDTNTKIVIRPDLMEKYTKRPRIEEIDKKIRLLENEKQKLLE